MGLLILLAFLVLFLLGFPVVLAIALPAIVYLLAHGLPLDMIGQRIQYSLDSYLLVAVPVFNELHRHYPGALYFCQYLSRTNPWRISAS